MELDDDDFSVPDCSRKSYRVLTEQDVRGRLDNDINTLCSLLHVSRGDARILLTKFKWDVNLLTDEWFADKEKVLKKSGLLSESSLLLLSSSSKGVNNNFTCFICFTSYSPCNMISSSCGHLFCETCYKTYIEFKILEGQGCVTLKCPQSDCVAVVADDMIETLSSDECKKRFNFYVLRSYIQKSDSIKWCPSPGCNFAIEFGFGSRDYYDVKCDCCSMFCWKCVGECHRPLDCETARAWSSMNNDVSANSLWLYAYTKPCPKCKNPIEKNRGCMHMTCPVPCCHQFCWMCLGDWSEHNEDLNYFNCNIYNEQTNNGWTDDEVNKREVSKYLKRYEHYFKSWALNQSLGDKAEENLKNWRSNREMIESKHRLQFVTKAWLQIIESRRVLKWTYAYAFYMNKEEKIRKQFFEFLQGQAEELLEKLQYCVENDLKDYFDAGGGNYEIESKVIALTNATNDSFKNFVRALENGLDDVEDPNDCIKGGKNNHACGGEISSTAGVDDDEYPDGWDCRHCSYYNINDAGEDCEMCALPTPRSIINLS